MLDLPTVFTAQWREKPRRRIMDLDLYADLENPFFPVGSPDTGAVGNEGSGSSYLETELKKLENLNTRLTAQNSALKKNISCLYKTSRFELERKENNIKSLQQRIVSLEAALYQVQSKNQNCDGIIDVPQNIQPDPPTCQDGVLNSGSCGPSVEALVPGEGKDGASEFKQKRVPSPTQFDVPNVHDVSKEKKHTIQPPSTELLSAVMIQEGHRSKPQASPHPSISKQRTHNSCRRDVQEDRPKLSSACGKENRRRTVRNVTAGESEGPPRTQCEVKLKGKPTLKREERHHNSVSLRDRGSKSERRGHKRQLSPSPVKHNSRAETTRAKRRKVDSIGDSARSQRMKVPQGVHKKRLPRPVRNGSEVHVELSNRASAKEDASAGKSTVTVPSMSCTMKEIDVVINTVYHRRMETKADEQEFSQRKSHCFLNTATASPDLTQEGCTVELEDCAAESPRSSPVIPAATVDARSSLTPTPTPEESLQLEDGEILSDSDSDVPSQPIPGREPTHSASMSTVTSRKSHLTSREMLDKHLNQPVLKVTSRPPDQIAVVRSKTLHHRDTRPDRHRKRLVVERHERDNLPFRAHHRSREPPRPEPWIY